MPDMIYFVYFLCLLSVLPFLFFLFCIAKAASEADDWMETHTIVDHESIDISEQRVDGVDK